MKVNARLLSCSLVTALLAVTGVPSVTLKGVSSVADPEAGVPLILAEERAAGSRISATS